VTLFVQKTEASITVGEVGEVEIHWAAAGYVV